MPDLINCIIVDDEPVARDILENLLSGVDFVNVIAKCKNAVEAFNAISKDRIDLVFLDINMPGISGLSFAKSINRDIKIIFTTAYREYAVEGFDLSAVDYLLKPISPERLLQSLYKFVNEKPVKAHPSAGVTPADRQEYIFVRSDRKMVKIIFDEIIFIESHGDYVRIHLEKGSVITRETISRIEALLPREDFIRTHRSFIVSRNRTDSYTNEYVETGGKQVPVSRSFKDEVLRRFGE